MPLHRDRTLSHSDSVPRHICTMDRQIAHRLQAQPSRSTQHGYMNLFRTVVSAHSLLFHRRCRLHYIRSHRPRGLISGVNHFCHFRGWSCHPLRSTSPVGAVEQWALCDHLAGDLLRSNLHPIPAANTGTPQLAWALECGLHWFMWSTGHDWGGRQPRSGAYRSRNGPNQLL